MIYSEFITVKRWCWAVSALSYIQLILIFPDTWLGCQANGDNLSMASVNPDISWVLFDRWASGSSSLRPVCRSKSLILFHFYKTFPLLNSQNFLFKLSIMFKPHDPGHGADGGNDSQCIRISGHNACYWVPGTEHDTSLLICMYCNEDQAKSFLDWNCFYSFQLCF